jgi:heptosyltransferase-1
MIRRRRPPLDALQPQRVCLIKPSALGDIVQTLPVLSALRGLWPQAHITWVVKDCFADLLTDHPELDQIVTFKPNPIGGALVREMLRLFAVLRREPYDLAIDLQGLLRSGSMAWATGAPRRIGFSCGREGSRWCYTDIIDVPPHDMPVTQRYWKVVHALGGGAEIPPASIGIQTSHRLWALQKLAGLPRPVLAIHPGAGWTTKRWPARHFSRIAEMAQRTYGASVVLIGGNDCRKEGREIADHCDGPVLDLTGQTRLRELAALCESVDVVLSGDSGPMHLAAAVGTPVVSIFTCTNVTRHAPFGQESRVVASHVHCAASHRKMCPAMICMDELTPFRVWPMLSETLREACAGRQPAVIRAAA